MWPEFSVVHGGPCLIPTPRQSCPCRIKNQVHRRHLHWSAKMLYTYLVHIGKGQKCRTDGSCELSQQTLKDGGNELISLAPLGGCWPWPWEVVGGAVEGGCLPCFDPKLCKQPCWLSRKQGLCWHAPVTWLASPASQNLGAPAEPEMGDGFSLKPRSIICESKCNLKNKRQKQALFLLSVSPMGKMWQSFARVQLSALRTEISNSLSCK